MFALVRAHVTARDMNRLLDAVIFNVSVGNVESHAKNYCIVLRSGRTEMAPLYDLMSGLDWANVTPNHAQDIGGLQRGRHIYGRHWCRLAEACALSRPGVIPRVHRSRQRLLAERPAAVAKVAAVPVGAGVILPAFVGSIGERARLLNLLKAEADHGAQPALREERALALGVQLGPDMDVGRRRGARPAGGLGLDAGQDCAPGQLDGGLAVMATKNVLTRRG